MQLYTVFHLNLAFSSIDADSHAEVVRSCYDPLLQLAANGFPIGIEASLYTLECIARVAPHWLEELRALLAKGSCELVAGGDSQIIGPLVPALVNQHNLRLGQQGYKALTGMQPTIAYVNEQAVSEGLLDIYLDEGFEAVVVEWDNPYSYNCSHDSAWQSSTLNTPASLATASGRSIKVIWNHAIGFQKFQRYVHGELVLDDYLHYLEKIRSAGIQAFPLYGSDAEVFGYRPGRYSTEADQLGGEWQRIEELFAAVAGQGRDSWTKPTEVLALWTEATPLHLATAAHPVSVKKQAKYNLTRWGLSGRNDLALNTLCFKRYEQLSSKAEAGDEEWRRLCRLWASDFRTHLTETRYRELDIPSPRQGEFHWQPYSSGAGYWISEDEPRRRLLVQTELIRVQFNANRGLAIDSLAFAAQGMQPVIGSLSHGFFDHISYGVDFYSNHLVMERFRERDRVTDLDRVSYELYLDGNALIIATRLSTKTGGLRKYYRIDGERLSCHFIFENNLRPEASIRLGYLTLLDCDKRCWYETELGGLRAERFYAASDFDHGAPVSSIVSSNCAVGATSGQILFGAGDRVVKVSWNPGRCAALPMLSSKQINNAYLNRLWFSLAEADETLTAGGCLLNFEFSVEPGPV